jgi:death on curing protein
VAEAVQYLDLADCITIAADVLEVDTHTLEGAVKTGAAQSALGAPSSDYFGHELYPDFHVKVAVLGYKLARNHPLPDGNKRSAYVSMVVMVKLNGRKWVAQDEDEAVNVMEAVATGTLDEETFAEWVQRQMM